jgi:hypothetical protein
MTIFRVIKKPHITVRLLAPLSSKTYNQNALNELKWMMKVGDGE